MYPNATQAVHAAPSVLTGRLTRMLVAAIAACIASLALFGSPAMAADAALPSSEDVSALCAPPTVSEEAPAKEQTSTCDVTVQSKDAKGNVVSRKITITIDCSWRHGCTLTVEISKSANGDPAPGDEVEAVKGP